MPWNGSGVFTRTNGTHTGSTLWVADRDAGIKILATNHDTNDQDMADGIQTCLTKDGQNAATANLDIGSNRITLVADGTAKTDAATVSQIVSNGAAFQATDSGGADAYVIALSPAITAYAAGQQITFKAANASTGASTLNVNGLGTKTIKKKNDQDLAAGDIEASSIVTVVYDGTNFQMTSQLATSAGSMSSFTAAGDSGASQTISDGNTLTLAGGTGIDSTASATDTITFAVDSTIAKLNASNTWTAAQPASTNTDTSNTGSVTLDLATYTNHILTFTGNVTLANPTTEAVGQSGVIMCIQDATGSRTLTLGSDWESAGGSGITLSTAGDAVDIVPYFVQSASNILVGAVQKAFA